LIQDHKRESNPGEAEANPLGDEEGVVSEGEGVIFKGDSCQKDQQGGTNGDKCLEIGHLLSREFS
jgi:hypothetical protein